MVQQITADELERVRDEIGAALGDRGYFEQERALFEAVSTSEALEDFLTLPAYEMLVTLS